MTLDCITSEVTNYDKRLKSWNAVKSFEYTDRHETTRNIVQWWNTYPLKKSNLFQPEDKPRNVWVILSNTKITKREKIYGTFYTLQYFFNNIELKEIQTMNNDYELAIIVNDKIIIDGTIYNDIHQYTDLSTINTQIS